MLYFHTHSTALDGFCQVQKEGHFVSCSRDKQICVDIQCKHNYTRLNIILLQVQCTRFSVPGFNRYFPTTTTSVDESKDEYNIFPWTQKHFYYWDDWITRWNPIKQTITMFHTFADIWSQQYLLFDIVILFHTSISTILIKLEFEWAFSMFINQNARSRKSKWSGNILNCWLMTAATLEGVKLRRDEAVLETRGFNLPRLRQQDHILSSTWNEAHVMKENVIW